MFNRPHHNRIASVLQSLEAERLESYGCLFGGGTAIVLARNEYRESLDIDFIISDLEGYRELRQAMTSKGLDAITRPGLNLSTAKDVRTDQYGIRTMLQVGGVEIKFEIVYEGRMELEKPLAEEKICGISTLTSLDMATTKLLANSDRWSDDAVFSRDLIDLAMVNLEKAELQKAIKKAEMAYGNTIVRDLNRAIERLVNRKGRLEECMDALKIDKLPKASLWKKIKNLKR